MNKNYFLTTKHASNNIIFTDLKAEKSLILFPSVCLSRLCIPDALGDGFISLCKSL